MVVETGAALAAAFFIGRDISGNRRVIEERKRGMKNRGMQIKHVKVRGKGRRSLIGWLHGSRRSEEVPLAESWAHVSLGPAVLRVEGQCLAAPSGCAQGKTQL
jgi:hypothetical protein